MNQKEFIQTIANLVNGVSRETVGEVLRTAGQIAGEVLGEGLGERVAVPGFGKFHALERAERIGRNPRNGDPIRIAGRRVAKFSPSPSFRDSVDPGSPR